VFFYDTPTTVGFGFGGGGLFFFFLFSFVRPKFASSESDKKIVVKKKGKEKQIFSRGNFKKKTIHKIIPRKKKNVRFVLRIKREKERERDEEDGGCICCPCD
tara:strand:- start:5110 stop:5415 length:306 start_codon:yes stop_codon:yes gene_type:complete